MPLTEQHEVRYLANVILVGYTDLGLSAKLTAVVEEIRGSIGAAKATMSAAIRAVKFGGYSPTTVGHFAVQVSNLADMLYVCVVDARAEPTEMSVLTEFSERVGVTRDQFHRMVNEAVARSRGSKFKVPCPSCNAELSDGAKFCAKCGTPVAMADPVALQGAFQIPVEGYAVEFCESTAVGFMSALDYAKSAHSYSSISRGKKIWHLSVWQDNCFDKVFQLALLLGNVRNRRVYHAGKEQSWNELFGFVWCARERSSAYQPVEYCFGKAENCINPWGCKQVRLDWNEYSKWFSYGQFRRTDSKGENFVWVFDKERIRHEAMTHLHKFRYCPHLRPLLVEAVLRAIPEQVEVTDGSPWKYSQSFQESPGSIPITEVEKHDDFEFKKTYYADGVRPKGLGALEEILLKAFVEAGVNDISVAQLVR